MKTVKNLILGTTLAVALLSAAAGQQADSTKADKQPAAAEPKVGE